MDTFRTPLSPPPQVYGRLGGSFFKNAYQRLATLGEKARILHFLANLYFLRELITFCVKVIMFW